MSGHSHSTDHINEQDDDDDIFNNNPQDYNVHNFEQQLFYGKEISTSHPPFRDVVRNKVRQQLEVSVDSPFSKEFDSNILKKQDEQRVAIIKEETNEIRRQLELVKNKLDELKSSREDDHKLYQPLLTRSTTKEKGNENKNKDKSNEVDKTNIIINKNVNSNRKNVEPMPKFRPLTGRADCPNCVCDRRSSICDKCIGVASVSCQWPPKSPSSSFVHKTKQTITDPDERPIRPAKDRTLGTVVEVLDDVVVPGRVYTISKSLNEKRSKLAQTIDELETLMDKVKDKEERLDKERKIVNLYKDQWQYGPNIGGLPATSRDRLGLNPNNVNCGKRNYESRLDANLARDTKSLLGFQHVESSLKLRQYNTINNDDKNRISRKSITPKQNYPIRSRSLESLKITAQRKKIQNVPEKRTTISSRSINRKTINDRISSSEMNLSSTNPNSLQKIDSSSNNKLIDSKTVNQKEHSDFNDNDDEQQEEVEEILEESFVGEQDGNLHDEKKDGTTTTNDSDNPDKGDLKLSKSKENNNKSVEKITWIPVFGETEIKQVKTTTPKRKVQIFSPEKIKNIDDNTNHSTKDATPSIQPQQTIKNMANSLKKSNFNRRDFSLLNRRPNRNSNNDKNDSISNYNIITGTGVSDPRSRNANSMIEARETLKAATSLLEQEQIDSRTKNQLIIRKRTMSPIKSKTSLNNKSHQQQQQQDISSMRNSSNNETANKSIVTPKDYEIARLEEKINELQKLLERLAHSKEQSSLISPITVTCSSPCCHIQTRNQPYSVTNQNNNITQNDNQYPSSSFSPTNKQLFSTLKDRLQKTKIRLTKTLEEEIEKHNHLKESVDYSLQKQNNLENQNELLKHSLIKSVEKCLKDLSNTFEYLCDNLQNTTIVNRSINSKDNGIDNSDNVLLISNATHLMKENKHLKQMKNHIETIERQRKVIFEELSKEKQRSNHLESQLKQNHDELKQLMEAKQKLESQIIDMSSHFNKTNDIKIDDKRDEQINSISKETSSQNEIKEKNDDISTKKESTQPPPSSENIDDPIKMPSSITKTVTNNNRAKYSNNQHATSSSQLYNNDKSDLEDSYDSIDLYRRYIQSISPDIESMKRERKLISQDLEYIKKMLTEIEKE